MVAMVEAVEKITAASKHGSREVGLHCWRGGMRSAAVAWLLDLYGFKVFLLNGGYKSYRKWVLAQFQKKYALLIVGGYTGSNKTRILHQLQKRNQAIVDLEKIAGHKGSAFGNIDMVPQPGQEMFENLLAGELNRTDLRSPGGPIWIEGESQRIGNVNIPQDFFTAMRAAPLFFIEIPFSERLALIVSDYGKYEKDKLINATVRIKKRLGGLETKNAVNFLLEDDVTGCFSILLKYYDKLYIKSTFNENTKSRKVTSVKCETTDPVQNSKNLLENVY
jgi:tRNA 2-selenouridine synthase